jgi:hypothetical protein
VHLARRGECLSESFDAGGKIDHQTHRPRFSPVMSPASASAFVWWLTVGLLRSTGSRRSQAQTSPASAIKAQEAESHGIGERGESARETLCGAFIERACNTDGQQTSDMNHAPSPSRWQRPSRYSSVATTSSAISSPGR